MFFNNTGEYTMSGIMDLITSQLKGNVLDQIVSSVGGNKDNTQRAIAASIPMILGALNRNAGTRGGAESLANALDKGHDGGIMGNLGNLLGSSQNQNMGNKILGYALGSRQNNISNQLGKATGLGGNDAGKLLSMLAPVVMGALGKAKKDNNLGVSGLQDLLGTERQNIQKAQPQLNMLEKLLDDDNDGDVDLSDILKKGSGLLGSFFK